MNGVPYRFNHGLDRFKHNCYNRLDVLPCCRDLFMNPVHDTGNDNVDRFKNRLEQISESFQQRRDEVVNGLPYCRNNIPDRIQHRADRCMNRIPDNSNNRLDQVDLFSDGIINRCPDADKKVLDTRPDGYEEVFD